MKTFSILALVCALWLMGCSNASTERFTIPELKQRSAALAGKDFERQQRSYQEMRTKFASDTGDVSPLVKIAQLFVLEARATGDHPYYYGAASGLVDHVLEREPDNFEALVTKGTVLMSYHRFREALAVAERAEGISKGGNAFVLGILVDANLELGNYDEAIEYCDAMLALRPDLRSYSRAAYIRELHGDVAGAKGAMKMAAESGMFGEEDRAWAFNELAKLYMSEGALDTAKFIFTGILEERPSFASALALRAGLLAAQGRHAEAVADAKQAFAMSPSHEGAEALMDVYETTGDTANARFMRGKVFAFLTEDEKHGWNIDREYAEFCLANGVHLQEALARAERDYKSRPNNIHSQEIYAWALAVNGRAQEAVPYIERALRLGSWDLAMDLNAARIYHLAGMNEKAEGSLFKLGKFERCLDQAERTDARELGVLVKAKMN